MQKYIKKHKLARIFVCLIVVLALLSNSLFTLAIDKLYHISSNYFLENYYRLDVIDNQKIQVLGRTNPANIRFMVYIKDHSDKTRIIGPVDQSTGVYSATVDLSDLNPETYFMYLFFSQDSSSYSGLLIPCPIVKTETEIYIRTAEYYQANDAFSRMLSALNPVDYLSTDGLYDTYEHFLEIKQKAEEIVAGATNDYEKILLIHDWVAENIYYDWVSFSDGTWIIDYQIRQSPYYVFQHRYAVCQGYSLLTQLMLRSVGVPCLWLSGYAKGAGTAPTDDEDSSNHAWNAAYANGRWVLFDVTWDSTNRRDYNEHGEIDLFPGKIRHFYFDPSVEIFSYDHKLLGIDTIIAGDYILEYVEGAFWITEYTGTGPVAVVPYSFGGIPITRICNGAFDRQTLIKSYSGSDLVVEPGPLKKIIILNSIETIEKYALTRVYYWYYDPVPIEMPYIIDTQIIANADSAAADYARMYDYILVNPEPVEDFTLNKTEIILSAGNHDFLTVSTLPENSVFNSLTFASSNPEVVNVNEYGMVIAKSSGTAQITVTADGITKTYNVIVTESNHEVVNLKIKSLPDIDLITIDHAEIVLDAKSSYDALSDSEKTMVINLEKLILAVEKINQLIEQSEEPEYKLGDIDGDDLLTVVDIVSLRAYIMGIKTLNELRLLAANVDGSGEITVADIVALRKLIMLGQ